MNFPRKNVRQKRKGGKNVYIQPTLTRRSNTSQIHRQISQNDFQKDFDAFHDNICMRDRFDNEIPSQQNSVEREIKNWIALYPLKVKTDVIICEISTQIYFWVDSLHIYYSLLKK